MRVGMITGEFLGFGRKKSGVADAVSGLSKALKRSGHDVYVFMPVIDGSFSINQNISQGISSQKIGTIEVPFGGNSIEVNVSKTDLRNPDLPQFIFLNLPVVGTVEPLNSENEALIEKRLGLFFDRAAAELMKTTDIMVRIGGDIDVLHAHTGTEFFAYFSRKLGIKTPTVYTIHHLERADEIGFEEEEFTKLIGNNEVFGCHGYIDPYAFALDHSDRVVVVSKNHAEELKAGKSIHKDERFFRAIGRNADKITGILNGLDERFTPGILFDERQIPAKFDREHLRGKAECKQVLQKSLGLPIDGNGKTPIFLWSARLVESKGIEVFSSVTNQVLLSPIQIIVFGRGNQYREQQLEFKAGKFPEKIKFIRFTQFNSAFEPLFLAGSDVIVLPSLEEPCGLLTFKAARLGTLALVNPVGGLGQVIIDNENGFSIPPGTGSDNMEGELAKKMTEIIELYQEDPRGWRRIQKNAMDEDSTWRRPAKEYARVYHELVDL